MDGSALTLNNSEAIERWIRHLGKTHDFLVRQNLIPARPLERLYQDSHSLELEPCPGVELVFWFFSQRFEAIYVTLISRLESKLTVYEGKLPLPFTGLRNQTDVHAALGLPYRSNGPMKFECEENSISMGGWDFYGLSCEMNHNLHVEFQYDDNLDISVVVFSVFDRES
jgi:hypothetical protein